MIEILGRLTFFVGFVGGQEGRGFQTKKPSVEGGGGGIDVFQKNNGAEVNGYIFFVNFQE